VTLSQPCGFFLLGAANDQTIASRKTSFRTPNGRRCRITWSMHLTDLKAESKDGILVATAAGRVSLRDAISVFTNVCDVAAQSGVDRILVDCLSVEGELSTMERYELGRTMAEYCTSRSLTPKVATVGCPPLINGFAARVAWNRGLVAETFSESQKARDWLNGFGSKEAAHEIG